jgi:hypothetical protein
MLPLDAVRSVAETLLRDLADTLALYWVLRCTVKFVWSSGWRV